MSDVSSRAGLHRLLTCVYWTAPAILSLLLYYRGLWCWFHSDDFSLLLLVSLPDHEFWQALWQPRAQGTLRPLSERLFFYYFYHWFGLDAFPYRLLVFATHVVNLMLLAAVTQRLTGRRWAGFVAASLWGLHHGLARSLTWNSAYNQILCAFFFLLGFWLFLRFVKTGRWFYYAAQWATFVLGFGVLEVMAVYPAILLAYVVLADRRYWPHVAVMFLGSAAFAWWQWKATPLAAGGNYQSYFDPASLWGSLLYYCKWAVADETIAVGILVGIPLLIVAGYQARRGNFLGLFFLAWFFIAISPYLPLRDHRSSYYLVIPTLGLAMLGGWAAVLAIKATKVYRVAAVMCIGLFLWGSVRRAYQEVDFYQLLSLSVKQLISDVSQARNLHHTKTILLTNVPERVFYFSIAHEAFRLVRLFDVYAAPGHDHISPKPGFPPVETFVLSKEDTLWAVRRKSIVVYDASGPRLVDVTEQYSLMAPLKLGPAGGPKRSGHRTPGSGSSI